MSATYNTNGSSKKSAGGRPARPARNKKQLAASIKSAVEELAAELLQGQSNRFQRFLDFAARFHRYSVNNQILIQVQCPDATHVASYKGWEKKGYHVAKGQRAKIRIFAPHPYVGLNDRGEAETRVYFTAAPVFDATQLNPQELAEKPLPTRFAALGSDEDIEVLYQQAYACMTASGIWVEERGDLAGDQPGHSKCGYVAIQRHLTSWSRVWVIIREWSYEMLLNQGSNSPEALAVTRRQRECQAEATAYVVFSRFGIFRDLPGDFLQNWGTTSETLLAELGMVQKAAATIIAALEARRGYEAEEEETPETDSAA